MLFGHIALMSPLFRGAATYSTSPSSRHACRSTMCAAGRVEAGLLARLCCAGAACSHRLPFRPDRVVAEGAIRHPRRRRADDRQLTLDAARHNADEQDPRGSQERYARDPCTYREMEWPSRRPLRLGGLATLAFLWGCVSV